MISFHTVHVPNISSVWNSLREIIDKQFLSHNLTPSFFLSETVAPATDLQKDVSVTSVAHYFLLVPKLLIRMKEQDLTLFDSV
jgi:hypothetical protein